MEDLGFKIFQKNLVFRNIGEASIVETRQIPGRIIHA